MRRTPMILPVILLLAACGGKEGAGNNSSDEGLPPATAPEQTDANLTMDGQNSVVPIAMPSPTPLPGLPADYTGRWAMVPEDCDPTRADAKGLMTVAGDRLTFYESRGTVSAIRATAPGRVTATIDFAGEGQSWRRSTALTLIDQGRTLLREEQDPAASFRYSRCPAAKETTE